MSFPTQHNCCLLFYQNTLDHLNKLFSTMKIPALVNCSSHESTFAPFIFFGLPILFQFYYVLFCSAGVGTGCKSGNKTVQQNSIQIFFLFIKLVPS